MGAYTLKTRHTIGRAPCVVLLGDTALKSCMDIFRISEEITALHWLLSTFRKCLGEVKFLIKILTFLNSIVF